MTQDIYAAEAKAKWGDTDAYKESQRRLAGYSKEDIAKAQLAMQSATDLVRQAMLAGLPADSEAAMAGAEAHRKSITEYWYECNFEIHKGLATMYLADPRFTAHYEAQQAGLAKYIHDGIMN
ncbi:MAG: TipAS antibiotic-recognition domain-containing protein, partial [Candidatus Nanopelagicaceae bacterium]